jgi:excisionase family DNA binding protein
MGGGDLVNPSNEKRLFSVDEAATYLGVSDWTIKQLLQGQSLASLKIYNRRLIPREVLDEFIKRGLTAGVEHQS